MPDIYHSSDNDDHVNGIMEIYNTADSRFAPSQ